MTFDRWSAEVGGLASQFPKVKFEYAGDLGLADPAEISEFDHRLYDRRRALGLRLSRGELVAMTEDQTLPADNWVAQILTAHEQPYSVIGGAVENGVDRTLNRALYVCDFGRYGRPFENGEVSYLSDVNLAYKRAALNGTRKLWWDAYQETTVNWALQTSGEKLFLANGPVMFQCRPPLSLRRAVKERIAWGRVFAETRAERLTHFRRLLFAAGTSVLPMILLVRALRNMIRQGLGMRIILRTIPIISLLVVTWSIGELAGYLRGGSESGRELKAAACHAELQPESDQ